jgi:hypothetical protein
MYIVILGEIVNFKQIVYDNQQLEVLADKVWKIKRYINSKHKDFVCSNFSSRHADYIEGVLLDSNESFELSKKIAKEIIGYINPFQINIAIVKGEIYVLDKIKADYSDGPAFWTAVDLLKKINTNMDNKSHIVIADSDKKIEEISYSK